MIVTEEMLVKMIEFTSKEALICLQGRTALDQGKEMIKNELCLAAYINAQLDCSEKIGVKPDPVIASMLMTTCSALLHVLAPTMEIQVDIIKQEDSDAKHQRY